MKFKNRRKTPALRKALEGHYGRYLPSTKAPNGRGLQVFAEVTFLAVIFTVALGLFAEYGTKFIDVESERRVARGERLIGQTREAISAFPYDHVTTLNGASFVERAASETSEFRIDVTVAPEPNGRLKVEAVLKDNRTTEEVSRFVTYRGRS